MAGYGYGATQGFSYPAIHQAIIESAYPPQVYRHMFEQDLDPQNQIKEYPIEDGDTEFTVNTIGEGEEVPIEVVQLTNVVNKTGKIAEGFPITFEMVQFAKLPIVAYQPKKLGLKIGNTIDRGCEALVSGTVPAGNVVAATGTTIGNDGQQYTRAGEIGRNDVKAAIRRVQEGQVEPTDIIFNPIGWEMLSKLAVYSSVNQIGRPAYANGKLPTIEGLRVHTTTNCRVGEAHIIAASNSSYSGQYIPMGFFHYNYDIRTDSRRNPAKDQNEVYAYSHYRPIVTRARNLAKITYGGSPYT